MRAFALLALPSLLAAATLEPLDTTHLAAVHAQRVEWMKIRAHAPPPPGVYRDFRAVLHIHPEGTKDEILNAARESDVNVVVFTAHNPDTWSGFRGGVLFMPGAKENPPSPFLSQMEQSSAGKGLAEYFQSTMKDPKAWKRLLAREKEFPDEVFAAGADALPQFLQRWDQEFTAGIFTGYQAGGARGNRISRPALDPYAVAFRHLSTHILARGLSAADIRESLAAGRTYVAHDWLCDPTGFSFIAENNLGLYDLGDQIPLSGLGVGATSLHASLPISARIKLIHDGVVVAEANDSKLAFHPREPGAYRLEAWLTLAGEDRPWIFTNPIYVTKSSNLALPPATLAPDVEARKDLTYIEGDAADAAKHKLDLYLPREKKNFPVLVFIHGGSWRSGDRSTYPALGNRFAKTGIGVAIPSYRLMPKHPHPAQIEDTAAAFAWVYKNISRFGGDASRIYIAGHSAGGHLAALLALDPAYLGKFGIPLSAIKGVASISGVYDVSQIAGFKTNDGEDSPSPIAHVHSGAPPFLVSYCQWDYLALPLQAREFAAALRKSFDPVELLYVPGQGHISEIIHIVDDDDAIAQAILKLIQ